MGSECHRSHQRVTRWHPLVKCIYSFLYISSSHDVSRHVYLHLSNWFRKFSRVFAPSIGSPAVAHIKYKTLMLALKATKGYPPPCLACLIGLHAQISQHREAGSTLVKNTGTQRSTHPKPFSPLAPKLLYGMHNYGMHFPLQSELSEGHEKVLWCYLGMHWIFPKWF